MIEEMRNERVILPRPVEDRSHLVSQKALKRVSNYRLGAGWLVLTFWFVSIVGLDWDAQWHAQVGRDGFWTPPHWMFYSSVTAAGVICLGVVLLETALYYRRYPGFNEQTTTPVLFLFRGPIGFILAGFGMLIMISSAPLDDYWHRIFGVDLKIWTPFHIMLLLGILISSLGMIYLFASEMNRRRTWTLVKSVNNPMLNYLRGLFNPATLGLTLAVVAFVSRYLFLMDETLVGSLTVANFKLSAYSLALAVVPLMLVLLVNVTKQVGAATFMAVLFELLRYLSFAFVDWGIKLLATDQGVQLRFTMSEFQYIALAYPIFLPLAGLAVDTIYLATRKFWKTGKAFPTITIGIAAGLAAGVILFLMEKPWEIYNKAVAQALSANPFTAIYAAANQYKPDYWQTLPLVALIAGVAGACGVGVSVSLKYTRR